MMALDNFLIFEHLYVIVAELQFQLVIRASELNFH